MVRILAFSSFPGQKGAVYVDMENQSGHKGSSFLVFCIISNSDIFCTEKTEKNEPIKRIRGAEEALGLTFELDNGERLELRVKRYEYNELSIGDRGMLTHQGTRYQGFEH